MKGEKNYGQTFLTKEAALSPIFILKNEITFLFLFLLFLLIAIASAQQFHNDAGLAVEPDGGDNDPSTSLHDVCPGEHHRIGFDRLFNQIRLPCQRTFVYFQIVALNDDPIGR